MATGGPAMATGGPAMAAGGPAMAASGPAMAASAPTMKVGSHTTYERPTSLISSLPAANAPPWSPFFDHIERPLPIFFSKNEPEGRQIFDLRTHP
jgi:hypothetical protein